LLGAVSLVFPSHIGCKQPLITTNYAYEIFYYTHLVTVYVVVALAMSVRFPIFWPILPCWGYYAIDATIMRVLNTKYTQVAGATCYVSGSVPALHLKIEKPPGFRYNAGQTAFIKVPYVSFLQWHPFSFASSPADEHLEFLIDCSHGEQGWTKQLYNVCSTAGKGSNGMFQLKLFEGSEETETGVLECQVYGPCGSSFQSFEKYPNILLIGGGSGLPSSLSVLRHLFHIRANDKSSRVRRVSFVWSTRHIDSLLWCWGHLKRCIEGECGMQRHSKWGERNNKMLMKLGSWLDITIHVTAMDQASYNMLIAIEKNSPVGSWLVHRLSAGRINKWSSVLHRFNESIVSDDPSNGSKKSSVKVFFCGPGAIAGAIREAAKEIHGFNINVSSENFHDN